MSDCPLGDWVVHSAHMIPLQVWVERKSCERVRAYCSFGASCTSEEDRKCMFFIFYKNDLSLISFFTKKVEVQLF